MKKTIDLLKSQLFGLTDKVNENLISTIKITHDHQLVSLNHLSLVNQKEKRIFITPFNVEMVGSIENELKKQGFNAYKFSKTSVVVNVTQESKEDSKKVMGQRKKLCEESKVSIRNIRKKFKKKENIDENQLQNITDDAIKEIESLI